MQNSESSQRSRHSVLEKFNGLYSHGAYSESPEPPNGPQSARAVFNGIARNKNERLAVQAISNRLPLNLPRGIAHLVADMKLTFLVLSKPDNFVFIGFLPYHGGVIQNCA